ncbi:hypothetical protein FG93_05282 [Bosea sp. LC85]|nr:hypothetical protein FG93_05282 [Bosea sp. LC85]
MRNSSQSTAAATSSEAMSLLLYRLPVAGLGRVDVLAP